MARICIVTPGQLGSNPRVVKEANSLVDAGHDVHVVATKVTAFVEPRDQALLAEARFNCTRVAFDRPIAWRLERTLQVAAGYAFRATQSIATAGMALSAMTRRLVAATRAVRADLYIAHYVAALPAAASAARLHRAGFAFDAEDFHQGDLPDAPRYEQEKHLIATIEAAQLPRAAYVTAAAPGIAAAYAETYGIDRPTVILNTFPKCPALRAPSPRGTMQPGPTLYWFSQTIGPGRGLECAVEAIALARSRPHLHVRGTPSRGYLDVLAMLAARFGVQDRLHFLPPALPADLERLAAAYDLGFVGETGHTRNRRLALTNKQFSYFVAGIPAVMSDVPSHIEFAADAQGAAFLFRSEDATSLAQTLDQLLLDPARLRRARIRAHELGQTRYNWEVESQRLLRIVDGVLERSSARASKAP